MTDTPLIEVITEAFHHAHCSRPDDCGPRCPHRMPTDLAVAVHDAVVEYKLSTDPLVKGLRKAVRDDQTEWVDANIIRLLLDA